MMKATKDRLGCDGPDALNRPMERGVLVQRAMNARFIIISDKLVQDPAQVRLPEHDHVVETFRRIVPISLSTYGFCHGDRGAIGLSRMPLGQKIEAVEKDGELSPSGVARSGGVDYDFHQRGSSRSDRELIKDCPLD